MTLSHWLPCLCRFMRLLDIWLVVCLIKEAGTVKSILVWNVYINFLIILLNFGIFVLVVFIVFILLLLWVQQFDLFCPSHWVGKQSRSEVQEDGLNRPSTDSFLLWNANSVCRASASQVGPSSNSIRDIESVCIQLMLFSVLKYFNELKIP